MYKFYIVNDYNYSEFTGFHTKEAAQAYVMTQYITKTIPSMMETVEECNIPLDVEEQIKKDMTDFFIGNGYGDAGYGFDGDFWISEVDCPFDTVESTMFVIEDDYGSNGYIGFNDENAAQQWVLDHYINDVVPNLNDYINSCGRACSVMIQVKEDLESFLNGGYIDDCYYMNKVNIVD